MNRINDKGNYLFVLRNYFVSLFHFLWFKFKKFIEEVFCEKGALKFLKKPWKKSVKELILLESLILPKKNSFTGIWKGLCLFICNTPFFFLTTDTLKTDGTEDSLHSTVRRKKMILSFQICKTIDFLIFAF